MKRRKKWLIVSAISLASAAFIFFVAPRQPRYEGRALDQWLADLSSDNYQTQAMARAAIRAIGPAGVPFLTNSLAQRNAITLQIKRKNLLPNRLVRWGRSVIQWHKPMMESRNAAMALQMLGAEGTNAIPALVAALADPSWMVAQSAAAALGSMGSAAVPALSERLQRAEGDELQWLLHAINGMGTNAAPLAPGLAKVIQSANNHPVASVASMALVRIGPQAIPALTNLLSSTNPLVQQRALSALTQIGPPAVIATNLMIELARSGHPKVRLEARHAFDATLPPRDASWPVWLEGLRDPDARNIEVSLRFLTKFPTNVRTFNREIAALSAHPTNSIRQMASNALTLFNAWPK